MVESVLISAAFNTYRRDFIAFKGQSKKTEESYVAARDQLLKRFGDIDISTLTFDDVRDWKLWLDKGRSSNTVRNYIVCLRVVLKFLRTRGYEVLSPDDIPVPKRVNTEIAYLTEDEAKLFFQEILRRTRGYSAFNRARNYAICRTLYATGLRNAELCSLDLNSIKENTFTVIGKGNKPRICFIDDETIKVLIDYLNMRKDTNSALFVNSAGKRMTPGGIRCIFEFIRKNSKDFKYVHPHTLRHSYATRMLNHKVDIRYLKEFMGHANLDTTAHYTHIINTDLKEIYLKAQAS